MNGSGTQYPPLQAASAATSPEGTDADGTQWAAPSVQQLGNFDGSIGMGGVSTQLVAPPEDAPLLDPTEASSPPAFARPPLPARGVPWMSVLAEQPDTIAKTVNAVESRAGRAARCMVREGAITRSGPGVGRGRRTWALEAATRLESRSIRWARRQFPSCSIANDALSIGAPGEGGRQSGDPPWRTGAPCSVDCFVCEVRWRRRIPMMKEARPKSGERDLAAAARAQGAAPRRQGAVPRRQGAAPRSQGAAPRRQGAVPRRQGAAPRRQGAAPRSQGAVPRRQGAAPRRQGAVPRSAKGPLLEGKGPFLEGKGPFLEAKGPLLEDKEPTWLSWKRAISAGSRTPRTASRRARCPRGRRKYRGRPACPA